MKHDHPVGSLRDRDRVSSNYTEPEDRQVALNRRESERRVPEGEEEIQFGGPPDVEPSHPSLADRVKFLEEQMSDSQKSLICFTEETRDRLTRIENFVGMP